MQKIIVFTLLAIVLALVSALRVVVVTLMIAGGAHLFGVLIDNMVLLTIAKVTFLLEYGTNLVVLAKKVKAL